MKLKFLMIFILSALFALPAAAVALSGDDLQVVSVDFDVGYADADVALVPYLGLKDADHGTNAPLSATIRHNFAIHDTMQRAKTFNSGTYMHRMTNSRRC